MFEDTNNNGTFDIDDNELLETDTGSDFGGLPSEGGTLEDLFAAFPDSQIIFQEAESVTDLADPSTVSWTLRNDLGRTPDDYSGDSGYEDREMVDTDVNDSVYSDSVSGGDPLSNEPTVPPQPEVTKPAMTAYEIHTVSSEGILNWDNHTFTTSIESYEEIFGQDINEDGSIGIDLGTLTDITSYEGAHQLKVDSAGGLYISDGSDELIVVKDATGGSPAMQFGTPEQEGLISVIRWILLL